LGDELDGCLCGGPLGPVVVLVVVVGDVVVVDVVGEVVVVVVVVVEVDPGVVVEVEVGDVVVVEVLVEPQLAGSNCLIEVTGSASGGVAWAATAAGVSGSEVGIVTVCADPSA
jgi:hypothetical protein